MHRAFLLMVACLVMVGCEGPKPDVTAVDLHAAYQDAAKADEQYLGKTVAVSGIVKWIGYTWVQPADSQSVYLGAESGKEVLVVCQFPPETARQAEGLREGQFVVIRGVCRGNMWRDGAPYLSKCAVVR